MGPRTVGGERVCVCVAFFCRKREGDARASVPFPPRGARGSPGLLATRRPRPVTESCHVFVRRALRPSGPPQRSDRDVEHRIQLNMYLLEVKEIRLSMTRARSKDYPYAYSTHIDSSPAGRQGCGLHHRQKSLLLYQMMRTYTTLTPPSSPSSSSVLRGDESSFVPSFVEWTGGVRMYDCIHTYIHTYTST